MLSPLQVSVKVERHWDGTQTMRSTFCSAVIGVPQAIRPTNGTMSISGMGSNPGGIVAFCAG